MHPPRDEERGPHVSSVVSPGVRKTGPTAALPRWFAPRGWEAQGWRSALEGESSMIGQRLCQLVEAYSSGDASRPDWRSARFFTATTARNSMVPKGMRSYAAKLAKEEHGLEAQGTKSSSTGNAEADEDAGETQRAPRRKRGVAGKAAAEARVLAPPAADAS